MHWRAEGDDTEKSAREEQKVLLELGPQDVIWEPWVCRYARFVALPQRGIWYHGKGHGYSLNQIPALLVANRFDT